MVNLFLLLFSHRKFYLTFFALTIADVQINYALRTQLSDILQQKNNDQRYKLLCRKIANLVHLI